MKKIIPKGFTLVELAVALTIVALVIGGLAVPLSKRLAEQQYADTQATLDKAVEALVGFAVLNGRLPCPDIDTAAVAGDDRDGAEDANLAVGATTCAAGAGLYVSSSDPSTLSGASWGNLPWQTLGLTAPNNADAWNNRLRYAVFTALALAGPSNPTPLKTSLGAATMLDIRCGNPVNLPPNVGATGTPAPGCTPTPAANPYQISNNAVFVVYSLGANGYGATPITGLIPKAFPPLNTSDQAANFPEQAGTLKTTLVLRRQFVTRARTDSTSNSGEYDDLLTFMSSNTLAAKLLNAGVYP
jgi:prepilin-type N-terminal cleavage/methylation domain-containing protein